MKTTYSYSEIRQIFSDHSLADRIFDQVFLSIDENADGEIDFVDAAYAFSETPQFYVELKELGLLNLYQSKTRLIYTASRPPIFPMDGISEPQCNNEILNASEMQQAVNLTKSICVFLAQDSAFIQGRQDAFSFCQPKILKNNSQTHNQNTKRPDLDHSNLTVGLVKDSKEVVANDSRYTYVENPDKAERQVAFMISVLEMMEERDGVDRGAEIELLYQALDEPDKAVFSNYTKPVDGDE